MIQKPVVVGRKRQPDGTFIECHLPPSGRVEVYVGAALSSIRRSAGDEETLDDYLITGKETDRLTVEHAASSGLKRARNSANEIIALEQVAAGLFDAATIDPVAIDPMYRAILSLYPPPLGSDPQQHVQHVLDLHRQIAALQFLDAPHHEPHVTRGRGAPKTRDAAAEVTVRAIMHYLHDTGGNSSAGWKRANRVGAPAERTADGEWALHSEAAYIMFQVRIAGLATSVREVNAHRVKYVSLLRKEGRAPRLDDYAD